MICVLRRIFHALLRKQCVYKENHFKRRQYRRCHFFYAQNFLEWSASFSSFGLYKRSSTLFVSFNECIHFFCYPIPLSIQLYHTRASFMPISFFSFRAIFVVLLTKSFSIVEIEITCCGNKELSAFIVCAFFPVSVFFHSS